MFTLTTILAATGALLGLGGLALGTYALLRSRRAAGDFRALAHRQLPDSSGVDVRAIRDVAVVRYDALEEMSGARSFSLAILNAAGDGVVVTSINGRTESRTYAKAVKGGQAAEAISPEEYRAIRDARLGQGPSSTVPAETPSNADPSAPSVEPKAAEQSQEPEGSGSSVRPLDSASPEAVCRREVSETAK